MTPSPGCAMVNSAIAQMEAYSELMLQATMSVEHFVQSNAGDLPAIQQAALNALIEERLKAQEITNYESLRVSDEEVSAEIAEMARRAGLTPDAYLAQLRSEAIIVIRR